MLWSTQRVTLAFGLAVAVSLSVCTEAPAMTLKLVFPDGQPMTHGSACSGEACLLRGTGIQTTNASGEIVLADAPDRVVEYRRDAIAWWEVPLGVAAGRLSAVGERATVVLPRMLLDTAPAVDAVELDIVALINAERAARGLALAVLNTRLSAAADLQATWLSSTAGLLQLPVLSHIGPFGSTLAFRLGEVSFPEPTGGAEIAAAGWTPAEAVANWMASAPHRDQVLAPGALLIGVAKVGSVIIVTTHPPCAGCDSAALAGGGPGALGPGDGAGPGAAGSPGTSATSGSGDRGGSSCGAERLRVQRLRARGGRLRLRVAMGCLRSSGRYTLSVIQRPSRSLLTRRKIKGPGAITLALRPSRNTRTLAIKLKRNGRVVATRTINRGAPRRAVPRAPARPGTSVSGERGGLSCAKERLRVQRLRARGGRLRLRVAMGCLRSSARYTLSVIQRPSRSVLTRRKIKGPGAITLALRPSRNTRALGIKLKRNGRIVATRTINRRAADRLAR